MGIPVPLPELLLGRDRPRGQDPQGSQPASAQLRVRPLQRRAGRQVGAPAHGRAQPRRHRVRA